MNVIQLLNPYRWWAAAALVVALGAGFGMYRASLIKEGVERERVKVAEAVAEQKAMAEAQARNLQEVKDEAIDNATKRAQANAASAAAARVELGKLRQSIANSPSVSGDSCAASVDRAATLGAVFGECSYALAGMAEKADGHASDALTLYQAWPTITRPNIDKYRLTLRNQKATQ